MSGKIPLPLAACLDHACCRLAGPLRQDWRSGLRTSVAAIMVLLVLASPLSLSTALGQTADPATKKVPAAVEADPTDDASPSDAAVAPADADVPSDREEPAVEPKLTRQDMLIASLTIFMLAIFVGFEVITKVPPTLHTPLMSGSNAISGITIVGALIVAGSGLGWFASFLGFIAVVLATINVVGGFLVTHRMLAMFKKR